MKLLTLDESINYFLCKKHHKYNSYLHYFYPEFESFNKTIKKIDDPDFDEKRQIGENDSYICSLIRKDLVEEFIGFISRAKIPLKSSIPSSIYETNQLLHKQKQITLIEYAAFFGSIQIFQFLRMSHSELASSLWLYSIHGRNPDIIHQLEESHIKPPGSNFDQCLRESIKCHHNEITNYFLNDRKKSIEFGDSVIQSCSLDCYNYQFIQPFHLNPLSCFHMIKNEYLTFLKIRMKDKFIILGEKINDRSLSKINNLIITSNNMNSSKCKVLKKVIIYPTVTSIENCTFLLF